MPALAVVRREPYRLLFPLGIVCAVAGLGLWIGFAAQPARGYPGRAHATLLMQGFAACFVVGFLLTMLPRALGLAPLGGGGLAGAAAAVAALLVGSLTRLTALADLGFLVLVLVPVGFAATRLPRAAVRPPPAFVGILLGVVGAVLGAAAIVVDDLVGVPPAVAHGARLLVQQAFLVLMVMSVGSFLIPKLMPTPRQAPDGSDAECRTVPAAGGGILAHALAASAVLGGVLVECLVPATTAQIGVRLGYALRASAFAWFVWRVVIPARLPEGAPAYLRAVRWAIGAIALGLALPVVLPQYTLAWEHLAYVAGVTWLTVTIAVRVVVGHGADPRPPRAAVVTAYGALLVLAALTRVAAGIWSGAYLMHLATAAALAIAALVVWTVAVGIRVGSVPTRGPA